MLKNVGRLALASFFVTAFAGSALAQDDMDGEGEGEPPADDWSDDTSSSSTASTGMAEPAPAAASGEAPTMGISVPLFTNFDFGGLLGGGAPFSTANFLYGLDAENFLNIQLGINFGPGPDGVDMMGNPVPGDDIFGIKLGAGYRMYKATKGKVRPYLEPGIALTIEDIANVGDVFDISLGALMGVDYALWDQFTIGAAIGANLALDNAVDTINFNLFTTGLNGTIWW